MGKKALGWISGEPSLMCWVWTLMMPKKDGFSLAEQIRKTDSLHPDHFPDFQKSNEDVVERLWTWWECIICESLLAMKSLNRPDQSPMDSTRVRQNQFRWIAIGNYFVSSNQAITHVRKRGKVTMTARELPCFKFWFRTCKWNVDPTEVNSNSDLGFGWLFATARSMDVLITKLRQKNFRRDPKSSY